MSDIVEDFETAKNLVCEFKGTTVSISYLQRKMLIGYNRAARLVDIMIEEKVLKRDENEPWKLVVI